MPAKYTIKTYQKNKLYHIYNRGINGQSVFSDHQDYQTFTNILMTYLQPKNSQQLDQEVKSASTWSQKQIVLRKINLKNHADSVRLIAFALLPNHFHFILKQNQDRAMAKFMQSLNTKYAMYFNHKYQRRGPLYEGKYKAIMINSESDLIHLSRYIHLKPNSITNKRTDLLEYPYSSYSGYVMLEKMPWIDQDEVLQYFITPDGIHTPELLYKTFVEKYQFNTKTKLPDLVID